MQSNPSMFIINTRGRCTFDTHNRRTVTLIMYLHMAAQTLVISFVEIGRVQIWIINLLYVAKYSFSSWISMFSVHTFVDSLSSWISQYFLFTGLLTFRIDLHVGLSLSLFSIYVLCIYMSIFFFHFVLVTASEFAFFSAYV